MRLALSFDERTASNTLQQIISATGNNATINIGSAHALNPTELLRLAEVAGDDKRLSASFNGAQLAGNGLHQFIAASGANTRCSVNTAQSTAIPVLLDAINLAGWTKNLSVDFNGAQLVADNLQRALIAAGMNTSISVNTAQASDIGVILHALGIAGDTKNLAQALMGLS